MTIINYETSFQGALLKYYQNIICLLLKWGK